MKFLTVAMFVFLLCDNVHAASKKSKKRPCDPITGDAVQPQAIALNQFKNRSQAPGVFDYNPMITIERVLAPGNDTNRFPMTKAATVTAYVAKVQPGGIETCNCHAEDPAQRDTHIDVVADPNMPPRIW